MSRRPPSKTPYGKKIKAKAFKPKPLDPSPYIWVQVPLEDHAAAFSVGGPLGVRRLVLNLMKEPSSLIKGKYFADARDTEFLPGHVIIRGDRRSRSLEVIGRIDEEGKFRMRPRTMDISHAISD